MRQAATFIGSRAQAASSQRGLGGAFTAAAMRLSSSNTGSEEGVKKGIPPSPTEVAAAAAKSKPTKGHRATANGFGVMMNSVEKDPFISGWLEASTRPGNICALEIGCAYGVATLEALRAGANHVVANDLCKAHLEDLQAVWEKEKAEWQGPGEAPRLDVLRGKMPDALKKKKFSELPPPTSILAANVIHFMSPDEQRTLFQALHEMAAPGASLFVSCDSPWTRAYAPFSRLYTLKRIFRHPSPGYHAIPPWARPVLPERLRQIPCYHVMEEWQLIDLLEDAGWNVEQSGFFAGDEGNPNNVNLDGREMVGARAVKIGGGGTQL